MQHIEHLAWTPGRDNKKIQKNSTDTRLIVVTLESRMSAMRCLSSCRSQTPTVSFLSSFSTTPTFEKHNSIKSKEFSCRSHSTWYEANQKQKWDLDLDSRIRFPLTLSYTHITMQPIEHLAWTPGRENRNPETSHDKVDFATQRSQMSEVRYLSSCWSQIPTVSFLSSFSVTPCYQTVVDTMKKKLLQDAATTPCSRRKLEPEFQWHGQLATDSTSGRESKLPCQLYWHKVDPRHAVDSDVRGEMSVFMLDSDSHCVFPSVIFHDTSFRNISHYWKPEASFMSPLLHLVRSESKTEVSSRPWFQNQISTDRDLDIYAEHHFNWHDSVLQVQYRPINLVRNQTRDLHRNSNMIFPLTLPYRQAAEHWTSGTDNKQSCPRYKHEVEESGVRRWDVCLHTEVRFHCISPVIMFCSTKCWDVKRQDRILRIFRRCQSVWFEVNWKTDVRSRSRLQNQISINTFLPSHQNATNWTPGLNTWQRQQKHRANSTDRRFILATLWILKSEARCLS